jgi:hypothetical protein
MDNRVGFARLKREPERLARQIEEGLLGMTVFEPAVGVAAKNR